MKIKKLKKNHLTLFAFKTYWQSRESALFDFFSDVDFKSHRFYETLLPPVKICQRPIFDFFGLKTDQQCPIFEIFTIHPSFTLFQFTLIEFSSFKRFIHSFWGQFILIAEWFTLKGECVYPFWRVNLLLKDSFALRRVNAQV